jgi:hypothetical protein
MGRQMTGKGKGKDELEAARLLPVLSDLLTAIFLLRPIL